MNNNLIVLVKRYFDKVNGNTYHSVQFEVNESIYHSGRTYGYEQQYEETFNNLHKEYLDINLHCSDKTQRAFNPKINDDINPKYIVIDNCKKKELDEIHEYK